MEKISMACSCHLNGGKKIHNYFVLETMLPVEYSYLICTFNEYANHSITSRFHLNCSTKDDALEWLEKYSSITKVTFSMEKQDNTIYARCSCMETENRCRTALEINLGPSNASNESSIKQSILHEYPTTVILHYTHDIGAISDMLIEEIAVDDFHDSNDESTENQPRTKEKSTFLEKIMQQKLSYLFDKGKSPQRTYNLYKNEIDAVFERYNTDNTQRPDLKWVEEQFYIYFERKHGIQFKEALTQWNKESNEASAKQQSTPDKRYNVLNSKIDELCKKYKPILPASKAPDVKPEPEISVLSASPLKVINSLKTSPDKNTPYVIKFNAEPRTEKLNFFPPLKLTPNDIVVQSRLPESKIAPNVKGSNHIPKMIGINDCNPQSITIPFLVNGIFILANDIQPQPPLKQTSIVGLSLNVPFSEKSSLSLSSTKMRKHPRKSSLKCEDPDDIIFTDRIEDLQLQVKSAPRKYKRKLAHFTGKKKKVILKSTAIVDGIENVICTD